MAGMLDDITKDTEEGMKKAIEAFKRDLAKIRTGRASTALLDGVKVEYYGTPTPLNQVASLQVVDARLITIKPWEKNLIPAIEKAIRASDLGLNPVADAELVRLPIPALTAERRKDLAKQVKKMSEDARVAVRAARCPGAFRSPRAPVQCGAARAVPGGAPTDRTTALPGEDAGS